MKREDNDEGLHLLDVVRARYRDLFTSIPAGECDHGVVLYLNPETYLAARRTPQFYARADGLRFDGMLITALMRWCLLPQVRRQSFDLTSLAPLVLQRASERGWRVVFLGGQVGHAASAAAYLERQFPGIEVVACAEGYFRDERHRRDVIASIAALEPQLVLVGMGGIMQDRMAMELAGAGVKGAIHTCGGFLTQTAASGVYYPSWASRWNLRWLYRVAKERHVRQRILTAYPKGVVLLLADCIRYRLTGRLARAPRVL